MRAAILFLATCFVACQTNAQDSPYVILVSFDGFRYDYVEKYQPPNFVSFIRKGSSASALVPSFPSKTFPNHYTLVTGLYPGNHGLVDNNFYDPVTHVHYSSKNKKVVSDAAYHGGTPLWQLAHENGMKSASYFWVGSEVTTTHPDYYYPYNEKVPDVDRVDQVLAWLALPADERPRFTALYFSITDDVGHEYGPDGDQIKTAVMHADSMLGRLMNGIARTKLNVNVIVVSDHGMKGIEQKESSYLLTKEILNSLPEGTEVVNSGSQVHVYFADPAEGKAVCERLKVQATQYKVLLREDFPPQWHYQTGRAGDMMLLADPGYYFVDLSRDKLSAFLKPWGWAGVHGYDPLTVPEMKGIFFAQGPNIRSGYTLEEFGNIHVYPFIARLLGLPVPAIDGRSEVLEKLYQPMSRKVDKARPR